jgi:hypothetical protein
MSISRPLTTSLASSRLPATNPAGCRQPGHPLVAIGSERLSCLLRHWSWADEALQRLDRQIAPGLVDDDIPPADPPFGAYYHWCALLCGLCEAALDHALMSAPEFRPVRADFEASLPRLRSCRDVLMVVPQSFEKQRLVVSLLDDAPTFDSLRRVHQALGEALRTEFVAREVEVLDPDHLRAGGGSQLFGLGDADCTTRPIDLREARTGLGLARPHVST